MNVTSFSYLGKALCKNRIYARPLPVCPADHSYGLFELNGTPYIVPVRNEMNGNALKESCINKDSIFSYKKITKDDFVVSFVGTVDAAVTILKQRKQGQILVDYADDVTNDVKQVLFQRICRSSGCSQQPAPV